MNEELFSKFEALTFDDVLIVPGYTEVLPDQTEITAHLTSDIQPEHAPPFGRHGYRHGGAPGDCPGARGRHRHLAPQPFAARPGG